MAKGKTDARTPIGLKCSKCGKMTRRHTEKNTKNTIGHKYFKENKKDYIFWSGFLILNYKKLRQDNYF